MSFDPRLIHPEEPPEDFDAVLEQLGEQLRDDAQMLAAKYPAPSPAVLNRRAGLPGKWRRNVYRWSGIVAAVAVAIAVMFPWFVGRLSSGVSAVDRRQPDAPPAEQVTAVVSNGAASAANALQELTGPEWEGVLDLLEHQDDGRASLSL